MVVLCEVNEEAGGRWRWRVEQMRIQEDGGVGPIRRNMEGGKGRGEGEKSWRELHDHITHRFR